MVVAGDESLQDLSRVTRDAPFALPPLPQIYNFQTAQGSPCVGFGSARPDDPCDDARRFLGELSQATRQTWDAVRQTWVPSPPAGAPSRSSWPPVFGLGPRQGPPANWDGVSASVSSTGDTVVQHFHGGRWPGVCTGIPGIRVPPVVSWKWRGGGMRVLGAA